MSVKTISRIDASGSDLAPKHSGGLRGRLTSGLLFAFALLPLAAHGAPTGGVVTAGTAVIGTPVGGTLTVDQSSAQAIIDWSSFSIAAGEKVVFDNGSGATLNRVTGSSYSLIDGKLKATGDVYLINANGVVIGPGGVVKVGGRFVASALDVANANFMAGGDLTFSGTSQAAVVNYGKIGALGGDVALIAATVENDGSITAPNGTAGLVAGYEVILSDQTLDQGKFSVVLGGAGTSVTNVGAIQAADAELRANGGNIYALAGNTAGVISATGVAAGGGEVWLVAEGGEVDVAGTITAQGDGGAAGVIKTKGGAVSVGTATIDASGGTWLIKAPDLEITPAGAGAISGALATTNVTAETTTGATPGLGGITLDSGAAIAWTSTNTLALQTLNGLVLNGTISLGSGTLDLTAGSSIAVNAPITVAGAGAVNLTAAYDTTIDPGVSILELSFANGASINYGLTNNGGALSIDGQAYTLLYELSEPGSTGPDNGTDDIAGIDNNTAAGALKGYYALATNVSQPSGQVFTGPLVAPGTDYYSGYVQRVFEGLGNTISGLTIVDPTYGDRVALFGSLAPGATIRDLGLLGGSVTLTGAGELDVGGYVAGLLAGNNGVVVNCFSTGSVSGAQSDTVGGLVAINYGGHGVVNSYDTGPVSGGADAYVGGLVGANHAGATVIDDYATGAVTGGAGASVGGLVGQMDSSSSIIQGYAAGPVSGGPGAFLGGLVYDQQGGKIVDGYYDADTTGQPVGTQADGSVGLTTAALKGSLPTGFLTSVWGQKPGVTYPYLVSFGPAP